MYCSVYDLCAFYSRKSMQQAIFLGKYGNFQKTFAFPRGRGSSWELERAGGQVGFFFVGVVHSCAGIILKICYANAVGFI